MKKLYTLILGLITTGLFAQDLHFSQVNNVPLWLNPAFTGYVPGKARVAVNYRNQWFSAVKSGFFKSPFMTTALNFDMPIKIKDDALGVGLFLASDQQGANTFTGAVALASVSYIKTLGRDGNHRFSGGAQIGYTFQSIKTQNFQFANQFVGNQFVSTINNNEDISKNIVGYLNLNAGIFWYSKLSRHMGMYAGTSFYNVTTPKHNILPNQERNYYWRWNVQAGMDIAIGREGKYHILPSGMFTRQAVNDQLNTGLGFGIDFKDNMGMTLGVYNRIHNIAQGVTADAIIPYADFNVAGFKLGFAYDVTISNLKQAGGGVGAFELCLIYVIKKNEYNPKYDLVTPRF